MMKTKYEYTKKMYEIMKNMICEMIGLINIYMICLQAVVMEII